MNPVEGVLLCLICSVKYTYLAATPINSTKEWPFLEKRWRQEDRNKCVLPEYPSNGKWEFYTDMTLFPGDKVTSGILIIACEPDYKVDGNSYSFCKNGQWRIQLGHCAKLCPVLASDAAIKVTCSVALPLGGTKVVNCDEAIDGTIAQFQCESFYEQVKINQNVYSICNGGRWNPDKPNCNPVCGRSTVQTTELIAGGKRPHKGKYPWQTALYKKYLSRNPDTNSFSAYHDLICGGSLLNQKVILTAAHCVTNSEGDKLPKDKFTVAVGKIYRRFDDDRDPDAQFSSLKEMYVPGEYKGDYQNYRGDIAILVTVRSFTLTKWIQPVCVDWGRLYDQEFLNSKNTGYVPGWGHDLDSKLSDVLQDVEVPYVPRDQCLQNLPEDFLVYLTEDKLCSGYINRSEGVCEGDSGGGLVSKSSLTGKYYLTGIVSNSPREETECSVQQYALYTKVSMYLSFIVKIELENRPHSGSCALLEYPVGGKWTVVGNSTKVPGDFVDSGTILTVECHRGNYVRGTRNVTCLSGKWSEDIGSCAQKDDESAIKKDSCILPDFPTNGVWKISSSKINEDFAPKDKVPPYTLLVVTCKPGYRLFGDAFLLCSRGAWTSEMPICTKNCPAIIKGEDAEVSSCTRSLRDGGYEVVDCDDALDNTIVEFRCKRSSSKVTYGICTEGNWKPAIATCKTETTCGVYEPSPRNFVKDTTGIPASDHPWYVAIYARDFETGYITLGCGGTLINPRVIISTAHCISKRINAEFPTIHTFRAQAGKGYHSHFDNRDTASQHSRIVEVLIPKGFNEENLAADIAVAVTEFPFNFTSTVQPICIDWGGTLDEVFFKEGNLAHVLGWGYIEEKILVGILKKVTVPLISTNSCLEAIPKDFSDKYLLPGTVCAGYLDNVDDEECTGFAGSGLISLNPQDGRYYLAGVIGNVPSVRFGHCNFEQVAIYTKISSYLKSFIIEKELLYRPTLIPSHTSTSGTNSCKFPDHIKNSKRAIRGSSNYTSGTLAEDGAVLNLGCEDGQDVRNGSNIAVCTNGQWWPEIGHCMDAVCPTIYASASINATCFNSEAAGSCEKPQNGTFAKYSCAPLYENTAMEEAGELTCDGESWIPNISKCTRVCGKKIDSSETVIVGGQNATKVEYPWNAAIYQSTETEKKLLICSGTLISAKSVITSARCVTNVVGVKKDPSWYTVTVGNFFRAFRDSRDENAQYSQIKEIHVHPKYGGFKNDYVSAIAILVTVDEFRLSDHVMPICMDFDRIFNPFFVDPSGVGIVVGWGYKLGQNAELSETLKEIKMPYMSLHKCLKEIPENFTMYLTFDAMCTGFFNTSHSATCSGDAGAGLFFRDQRNGRYYLAGITAFAAVLHRYDRCENQHITTFTKIIFYKDFIMEHSG